MTGRDLFVIGIIWVCINYGLITEYTRIWSPNYPAFQSVLRVSCCFDYRHEADLPVIRTTIFYFCRIGYTLGHCSLDQQYFSYWIRTAAWYDFEYNCIITQLTGVLRFLISTFLSMSGIQNIIDPLSKETLERRCNNDVRE